MDLESEFSNLSIKFIFVCDDVNELNVLLNDLNSLDYKSQKIVDSNVIVQFIESLSKIPTTSDTNLIIKACHLIKQLITKQKISLPENISTKIINWILRTQTNSKDSFSCCSEALEVLSLLFRKNIKASCAVS